MNRAIKVISLILATLMLVSMATACKKSDGDIDNVLSGTTIIGGDSTNNNDNGGSTDTNDGPANDGAGNTTDTNDGGTTDKNNGGATNNNGGGTTNNGGGTTTEYDSTMKYDMDSNPLLRENKAVNHEVQPSFDIDTTGFVKNNIKVADLKGKTLTLITAREGSSFIYQGPKGEELNELTWFDSMKKTYGLNLKYILSRYTKAPQQILTYMNSGKALDIYHTMRSGFPQYMMLGRAIDDYINLQYVGNSPGVDEHTMEQMKWDDTYRAIGPVGAVDVIWYNETMTAALGIPDPHTLWKSGKWDWDAWENFQVSVPKTNSAGQALTPWAQSEGDAWNFWARTNGVSVFEIKTTNGKSQIISNFNDQRCMDAWTFYAGVVKGVDSVNRRVAGSNDIQNNMYIHGTAIMTCTSHLMEDYREFDYAKTQKYNWVPYPKGPGEGGANICMNYGYSFMIPKKVKTEKNIPYSIKFAELWATRFTEAIFDNFQMPYYNFSYQDRKDYFEFVTKNAYFAVGADMFGALTGGDLEYYKQFTWSFYNPNYNTATQAEQLKNLVTKAIEKMSEMAN